MATYRGRSRLLLKATGSSMTMGVRQAPRATGMTMQSAWSLLWGSTIPWEPSPVRSRPQPGDEFADNLPG